MLVQRQDMTYAERSWAGYYEINDVVAMHAVARPQESMPDLMERLSASIPPPTCDPRRLSGVSGYHEIAREFSLGDHIQFTAPDKSLGVANRDLATIESFTPDGRIAARLDDNRQIEFNAQEHRHFDHGYAVSSHSSQGLTAERVLVNADTGVHPDLLNSRFGYVSISRASHEAMLFTDDVAKLSPSLQPMYQRPRLLKSSSLCPLDSGLEWVDPFPRIFQTPSPGHWPTCSNNVTSIT